MRIGNQVSQQTLLNLGRHFTVPKEDWPVLCARLEQLLGEQESLLPVESEIEKLAQRYVARLINSKKEALTQDKKAAITYQAVDVDSLEMVRPRCAGVEHAGLVALSWLGIPDILASAGFNGIQRAMAMGVIIGRMAHPASELGMWCWLRNNKATGELLDADFEGIPVMRLYYRVSDLLIQKRG